MSEKAFCGGRSRCAAITAALGTRAVVLVGIMGAGKSSIGRRLAHALELPFYDADEEVERAARSTISEIFAQMGEKAFRDGERNSQRQVFAFEQLGVRRLRRHRDEWSEKQSSHRYCGCAGHQLETDQRCEVVHENLSL